MAHSEATAKTTIPLTITRSYSVELWPRNTNHEESRFTIEVLATSKQEAINKAITQHPGHAWGVVRELGEEAVTKQAHEGSKIHDVDDSKPYAPDLRTSHIPGVTDQETTLGSETLTELQAQAAKQLEHDVNLIQGGYRPDVQAVVNEYMTRAYNAGYQAHQEDAARTEAWTEKVKTSGLYLMDAEPGLFLMDAPMDAEEEPCTGEASHAEEPEEARQWRIQRQADQASVIELILHYKNPASDAEKLRQIAVVMG